MKLILTLALVSTSILLSNCANGHCMFTSKKKAAASSCSSCCAAPTAAKKTVKH